MQSTLILYLSLVGERVLLGVVVVGGGIIIEVINVVSGADHAL